jgi:hypothetical protein
MTTASSTPSTLRFMSMLTTRWSITQPPPFRNNEWDGERGHRAWNDHDEVDMVRRGEPKRE